MNWFMLLCQCFLNCLGGRGYYIFYASDEPWLSCDLMSCGWALIWWAMDELWSDGPWMSFDLMSHGWAVIWWAVDELWSDGPWMSFDLMNHGWAVMCMKPRMSLADLHSCLQTMNMSGDTKELLVGESVCKGSVWRIHNYIYIYYNIYVMKITCDFGSVNWCGNFLNDAVW